METVVMPIQIQPALLVGAVILALGTTAARADPIPQNVLDNSYNSCGQSCLAAGQTQDKCTTYCDCSVNSIEEKFTAQEFDAMNSAVTSKLPVSKGSQDKLNALVAACKAKAFPK
jgi:hypothetical protein